MVEQVLNIVEVLDNAGTKVRSYDKLVNFTHFNPLTNTLFVSFLAKNLIVSLSLATKDLLWIVPTLQDNLPLCAHSDQDKLILAYDSNKILVLDLLNKRIHDWSKKNSADRLPANFLNRYNRIVGITQVSPSKYILYTHYTYIVLDLTQDVPLEVEIIQNHPGKNIEEKSLQAESWFENLKLS